MEALMRATLDRAYEVSSETSVCEIVLDAKITLTGQAKMNYEIGYAVGAIESLRDVYGLTIFDAIRAWLNQEVGE